ncbi:MAG: right-handed parallel beta-helix repeat-containing protein [Atribacterota bacterium]|nr:right-handed parallel beta-helix repeat-containing protein [Atribacterota bacterium]MDD4896566.1 right-handed parallel beta-helix repeat-containing protein [Atribacterota bacterium]MDD5637937.1 right-handed parallel beta-helix repeat-containing protein [Atribacterota bacterium]
MDGGGNGSVLSIEYSDNITIERFTIQNGEEGLGGGIKINGCSPTVQKNVIQNNAGGGIYVDDSSAIILDNTIKYNESFSGGGIEVLRNSSSIIKGNIITYNIAETVGGGISIESCAGNVPVIIGNFIAYNTAKLYGGIYMVPDTYYDIPPVIGGTYFSDKDNFSTIWSNICDLDQIFPMYYSNNYVYDTCP